MFKQKKRKFIETFAAVTMIVTAIFYLSFNIIFIRNVNDRVEAELKYLSNSPNIVLPNDDDNKNYFIVTFKEDGTIDFYQYGIDEISSDEAISYAENKKDKTNEYGRVDKYYYIRVELDDNSIRFIFLDCQVEFENLRHMALVSGLIALALWIITCAVTYGFSDIIIAPYINQYENEKKFITNASHELKTPLSIIQANIELLNSECPENDKNKKWLESTLKQTNRMKKLVNNLVLLTKLNEKSTYVLQIEKFNLSELLKDAASTYENIAENNNYKYSTDIEDNIFYNGDVEAISKLIFILLDNAIKYTTKEGSIHISLHEERKTISMIFSNTTDNLSQEKVNQFFDRFYRGDESRSQKTGFGIGLSLAKSIVESHKGTINAEAKTNIINFVIKLKNLK